MVALIFVEQPVYIASETRDGQNITTMRLNVKKEIKDMAIAGTWGVGKHRAIASYDPQFNCVLLFKDYEGFEHYKNKCAEVTEAKKPGATQEPFMTRAEWETFKAAFMKDYEEFKAWKKRVHKNAK
jgi:hypothetical protein